MTRSLAAIPSRPLEGACRAVPWPQDVPALFAALARKRGCVWLDSAGGPAGLRRWSVLAAEPSAVLVSRGGATRLETADGAVIAESGGNPLEFLRECLAASPIGGECAARLPFGPGFYGYLSYDLAPHVEPKAGLAPRDDIALPDLWFGLYEAVLVLDHDLRQALIVGGASAAGEVIEEALAAHSAVKRGGSGDPPRNVFADSRVREVSCNMTPDEFRQAVAKAREYIAAGDIYQVNLSRRYRVLLTSEGGQGGTRWAALYLRLRRFNPAPYAAYIDVGGGAAVLSSSPELFLDLRGGRIVTRPIKGTRPLRPGDEAANALAREALLASQKDRAELTMIVDLERNDLGRVSEYGSVRVTEPRVLEAYAAVYHTVATVEGRLHAGRDVVDLLKATFPGGSITGAPKVRAMQIIAELEPTRRSVYTGAVGYMGPPSDGDPAGRCALNIAIRTLIGSGDVVHVQVGGGIVADSTPEAEFQETSDKARAMLAALGISP
ncbi:MAG: anthranilate synthase component I family protein [Planctomycetota bacterium]|nr:anthranilate synthase component I family protein [Planctomycetota bacterium]